MPMPGMSVVNGSESSVGRRHPIPSGYSILLSMVQTRPARAWIERKRRSRG